MSISTVVNKRIKIFILSLLVIVIAVSGTYFVFSKNSVNEGILLNNKNLKVILKGDKTLKFGEYPMSFQQGYEESPSNIYKIVNKSKFSTNYQVIVTETSRGLDKIDLNKIVVAINEDVKLLSDVLDGIVYESTINSKKEDILDIKIWLNKDKVTEADKNRNLNLKIEFKEI